MAATRELAHPSARAVGAPEPLYVKLKPGPGRSASEVAAHQRARIHSAMVELVAQRGYSAVTARELARIAGVSTRAFYKHFEGKEDCFLRTHELVVRRAAVRIVASQAGERDWLERLRLAFGAFARELEREPRAAHLALVEVYRAGPAALERARRAECTFAAMIGESFRRAGDGIVVPPLVIEGMVSGIVWVARSQVTEGQPEDLAYLGDRLMDWVLCYRCEAVSVIAQCESSFKPASPAAKFLPGPSSNMKGAARSSTGDRALILSAVAKLVAANGYDCLTVARIRGAAGVSHKVFKAHFDGVEDCFLAAFDQRVGRALSDAVGMKAGGSTWGGGVYRAISAFCKQVTQDPLLAGICSVDISALGRHANGRHERLITSMEGSFDQGGPMSPWFLDGLARGASLGAAWSLLQRSVASGRAPQAQRLGPSLAFITLAPVIGAEAAMAAILGEQML